MKKAILFLFIIILTCGTLCSLSIAKEFSDLSESHWAHKYVSALSDKGTISGYKDGTFRPSNSITRAEFLKLIVSEAYSSMPGLEGILSIPTREGGRWYDTYVMLAAKNNPYNYSGDTITMPITRLEAAVILNGFCKEVGLFDEKNREKVKPTSEEVEKQHEAAKKVLYEMKITKSTNISSSELNEIMNKLTSEQMSAFYEKYNKLMPFKSSESYEKVVITFDDVKEFGSSDETAVSNIARLGLMIGYEDGTFKPLKNMTRAEVATIIYRFSEVRRAINE